MTLRITMGLYLLLSLVRANATDLKPPVGAADFAGAKACTMCHADEAKGLGSNPHAKLAMEHNGKGVTCEGCHGPGKAHVDSGGDSSKIFSFARSTPKRVEEQCLQCHQGDHQSFDRSSHGEAKMTCIDCHSIHKPGEQAVLS